MTRAVYRSPACALRVNVDDQAVYDWLSEFLTPCLQAEADAAPALCDVRLVIDHEAFHALKARGAAPSGALLDSFRLDHGLIRLPLWRGDGAAVTVFDEALEAFYCRRRSGEPVDVVAAVDSARARVALMRVVRELTMTRLVAAGWLIVHAAAFVVDGRAVLVVGPKRAGKTTLLTYALTTGAAPCLLANDRVAIALDGSRAAWGVPTIVSLRVAMMRRFPLLARRLQSGRYDFRFSQRELETVGEGAVDVAPAEAWSVTPMQYCDLVGASLGLQATVSAIVFPQLMDDGRSIELQSIDAAEAAGHLSASVFRPHSIDALFTSREGGHPPSEADLVKASAMFIDRSARYACRIGADAEDDGVWIKALAS
jgi:hypothetical protein